MLIFSYEDYPTFMRAYIEQLPKRGWGFASKAAEVVGISGPAFSQVLAGEKQFSIEQALSFAEYIEMTQLETDYFLNLVHRSRAANQKLVVYYDQVLQDIQQKAKQLRSHVEGDKQMTSDERSEFYSNYVYCAIRLYASLGDGKSFDEIQKHFQLPPKFLQNILDFLVENELCWRLGNRYKLGKQKTFAEKGTPTYFKHSTNWRLQAIQKLNLNEKNDLFITSPMSISTQDFLIVREQLMEFIKSLSERVAASKPEDVVCLNIDYFRF